MNAPIPILDLRAQHAALGAELEAALRRVLAGGRYVLGPEGAALETELAAALGVAHAVGCASGTDALTLALLALELEPGDEVLVPAFSFTATAEAVARAGAAPVFVDIDPDSLLISPAACAAARTARTRALIAVHLYGRPAAPAPLRDAVGPDVALIEDCAQSFGARAGARAAGSLGAAGCFSFFPSKNLGACGDGGAVSTDDAELAARLRSLRNHGAGDAPYRHERVGLNSRLDELQAALLRVKLPHVAAWNRARARIAARYAEALDGLPELTLPAAVAGHVWHQYTVRHPRRDAVRAALAADGIDSRVYYPEPLPAQPAYARWAGRGAWPESERACRECLSLPMYPELADDAIDRICARVRRALA